MTESLSPLVTAAIVGDANAVRNLIKKGADVEVVEGHVPGTPLIFSAERGHIDTLELLLESGAQINSVIAVGAEQHTALIRACIHSQLAAAELLLTKGADANLGWPTPLAFAVAQDNSELVNMLIRFGGNANARRKGFSGNEALEGSPLFYASAGAYASQLQVLLDNGAQYNKTEGSFLILAAISRRAQEKAVVETVTLLREHGADGSGVLHNGGVAGGVGVFTFHKPDDDRSE